MDKIVPIPVQFRGATLYGVRIGGVVFIALKPIVTAMGIAWHGQLERVKRDPILRQGIRMMRIPSVKGEQESVCLRLSLVNGWLFKIDSGRIKDPTTRALVQVYQRDCYEVLWRHFSMGRALPDRRTASNENRSIKMVHEARMIFGNRVAAKVWHIRGMPEVDGMDDAFKQGDLFDRENHAA
jgi:P22_AR N-terminal domain